MKSLMSLANDAPKLSAKDLDVICRSHDQKKDRKILKRDGLQGMERMEDWGLP